MDIAVNNPDGYATRGDLAALRADIVKSLQNGEILIPQVKPAQATYAGGTNHCPNSDLSYSKSAATVIGTLPGDAGDGNQEAYRFFRQAAGADVVTDAAHALKAVGHSLYAADEGANPGKPDWDRVNGWVEIGATGTQYDIAIQLLSKLVGPGQRWFVRVRVAALDPAIVPANVQLYAGVWEKTATGQGWVTGGAFTLSHEIKGLPGSQSIDYRVLAKTDSGVSILSNVLTVANAPDDLSETDYVKLFYNAGPGFIEFHVFKKVGGLYQKVHVVRNSTDLQFNDIGSPGSPEPGWPADPGNAPRAYAETRNLKIAAAGAVWGANDLTISIPSTYNFSLTNNDGQFLRIGLTAPTGIDRHIGIDRIWFSTTYNEWAPDLIKLSDGTAPIPSISPTQGSQGGGTGVTEPPDPGTGHPTCIVTTLPVLVRDERRLRFQRFSTVQVGDEIKGEHKLPYVALRKPGGAVSEYYVIETANGIVYECTADHRLVVDLERRTFIEARQVKVGMKLASWVKSNHKMTRVTGVRLIPRPAEVGTFTLRHSGGLSPDGEGMYIAGRSEKMDRGLFSSNVKISLE